MPAQAPIYPAPTTDVVYESDRLLARRVGGYSNRACIITFAPFEENVSARAAFGGVFFQQVQIDAIHVIPAGNDWYQYEDLPQMCARIRELAAGYDRVIAYGSSMGAYAAIRFGGWAGAQLALAISPQFSAAPHRPPFEQRWFRYAVGLKRLHERGQDAAPEAIIIYDPLTADRRHAELYRSITRAELVPIPYSGHPSGVTLMQAGLLAPLLVQLCDGTFDIEAFRRETRTRSQDTPQHHIERTKRARGRRRRYQLALEARAASPGNPSTLRLLSDMALAAGEREVAVGVLRELMAIEPDFPSNRYFLGRALARTGQYDEAIALIEPLIGSEAHRPAYRRELWRAKLQRWWRDITSRG